MVEAMFHASIYIELGDGNSALFGHIIGWKESLCCRETPLQYFPSLDIAPCLCNAVGARVRMTRPVAQALQDGQWFRDITGALTVQVLLEYLQVWEKLGDVQIVQRPDKVRWRWSHDKNFSNSSAYRSLFIGQHPIAGAKLLCKTRAPAKCKFFTWLLLHDRCWTANRRKRNNLKDDDSCTLCNQQPETIDHLLINCPFSREVWFQGFQKLGWHLHAPGIDAGFLADWWPGAPKRVPKVDRKSFDSLVILVCWLLFGRSAMGEPLRMHHRGYDLLFGG